MAIQYARAIGFASAGNPLGGAIAGPVVGLIALVWCWQVSCVVLAFLGVIWWLAWRSIVTDHPSDNPHVSEKESLFIKMNQLEPVSAQVTQRISFFYFVTKPTPAAAMNV